MDLIKNLSPSIVNISYIFIQKISNGFTEVFPIFYFRFEFLPRIILISEYICGVCEISNALDKLKIIWRATQIEFEFISTSVIFFQYFLSFEIQSRLLIK